MLSTPFLLLILLVILLWSWHALVPVSECANR